MNQKTQDKDLENDFLYDDIDEQTLLEIENDIASQEENDEDEGQSKNQEAEPRSYDRFSVGARYSQPIV